MTRISEQELEKKMEEARIERQDARSAELYQLLEKYNCVLIPVVMIVNNTITQRLELQAK